MNEGHNVIKSNFDRSPARRMVFVFLFLGKRKFSCTSSTRRFIFQRCYGPKKIFVCRTPGHIRILYQQQNNSVIMWTHFSPITPDKIISIIDVWGMDCLFTPNCPIGEAKRLTSQNSGCQQFGYWGHRWEMLIDCLHVGTWKFKEKMLPLKTRRKMMY